MKALVIGSGAREHALVRSLLSDPEVDAVLAAPGNPGIDIDALCVPVDATDPAAVVALARQHTVDLVVDGVKIGSGRREPSTRPSGRATPDTDPLARYSDSPPPVR